MHTNSGVVTVVMIIHMKSCNVRKGRGEKSFMIISYESLLDSNVVLASYTVF